MYMNLPQGTGDSSVVVAVSFFEKLPGQQLEGGKRAKYIMNNRWKTDLVCWTGYVLEVSVFTYFIGCSIFS